MASTWRLAKSLIQLRDEINERWPARSKNSDGTIGNDEHSVRKSDHNPVRGIVHAMDITHDPLHGLDSYKLADAILKAQDPRLEYVISNRRIGSGPGGPKPGVWRKYTGANPHDHHVHFSVGGIGFEDDDEEWNLDGISTKFIKSAPPAPPTLRQGNQGDDVVKLQRLLAVDDDGDFGPKTKKALIAAQKKAKIIADGICGPQTWNALGGYPA